MSPAASDTIELRPAGSGRTAALEVVRGAAAVAASVREALAAPDAAAGSLSAEERAAADAATTMGKVRGALRRSIGAIDLGASNVAERHHDYVAGAPGPGAG